MTFFDTLKDKNTKALFRVIAPILFPQNGQTWDFYVSGLTFEQRVKVFRIAHNCLKALDLPNGEQPQYLNDPLHSEADA